MLDTERESLMAQRQIAHEVFLHEASEWRRCEKEALGLIVSYSEPRVKEVPYPTATDDTRENFRLHLEWVDKIDAIKSRAQYQVDVMMLYGEAKEHSKIRDDARREVGRIDELLGTQSYSRSRLSAARSTWTRSLTGSTWAVKKNPISTRD